MTHILSPNRKYKAVQVNCASFLEHMADKVSNCRVGFSLLGGRNPFEITDERACDMYALTHMVINETHKTDGGYDMNMTHYLAFGDGLESYLDETLFQAVKKHLPTLPDGMVWQLQQISLTNIDPKKPNDIATQDVELIGIFSGQLVQCETALSTIVQKQPNEQFCLLYQATATEYTNSTLETKRPSYIEKTKATDSYSI